MESRKVYALQSAELLLYVIGNSLQCFCLLHCKQDPTYVFPEMKLCRLIPNFHTHVFVSALYIYFYNRSTYLLQQNRRTDHGNTVYKLLTDTYVNVGIGKEALQFHF
jgi:hypothetical protein